MRFGSLLVAIGWAGVAPQPVICQVGAPDATGRWLAAARDGALSSRLVAALDERDRATSWQAARAHGPAAAPTLWRLLGEAGKDEERWRLLVAIVAAGGGAEDDALLRWAEAGGRSGRDRAFVALLLAIGPPRRGQLPAADVWQRLRGPSAFAAAAAACAAARFPAGAPWEAASTSDVGVVAALAFGGAASSRTAPPPRGDRREALWWRGVFLRAAQDGANAQVRERALAWRSEGGAGAVDLRAAAWRCAALAGDVPATDERPEPECLAALAGDARTRERLRDWFVDAVGPRDEQPQFLAVAHALTAPAEGIAAVADRWRGEAAVERHVAVALAWRRAMGESLVAIDAAGAAWAPWLVARGGQVADAETDDPRLRAALAQRARGRLDDGAFAAALEDCLWRWGSHPALAVWRLERRFVRDLLLAGSQAGAGKYQPHLPPEQRYVPDGIGGSDPWFDAAVAAYEFLEPSTWPLPPALRLRP